MNALSDKLQEMVTDFANGEADDTCQDAFNRLIEYAEELESGIAKMNIASVKANKAMEWLYRGPT